ncbi:hypothetical protein C0J52_18620 [Blattella germanica]|nr:hypothetical protein C0J52_18620 [Blattella germanica]
MVSTTLVPTADNPGSLDQLMNRCVSELDHQIHVIEVPCSLEQSVIQQKPPDYDSVADAPPCYEDAIKLSPSLLLTTAVCSIDMDQSQPSTPSTSATTSSATTRSTTCSDISSSASSEPISTEPTSVVSSEPSSSNSSASSCSLQNINRIQIDRYGVPGTPPPPYAPTR